MHLAEIYLEAVNPARGCHRAYRLTLTEDLFGAFIVETRYGRIGAVGHALSRSFITEPDAREFMQSCMKRRQSAPRRLGTGYLMRACIGVEEAVPA
jgi:predicted DNA-binding WGR domain protein